jgi:hypothetical protein
MLLVALGVACFLTFGRTARYTALTGPLFLVGAVAAALIEAASGQLTSL